MNNVPCTNCGKQSVTKFEAVPICADCAKIVGTAMRRTKREIQVIVTLYRDRIKKLLCEGRLRPGALNDQSYGVSSISGDAGTLYRPGVSKGTDNNDRDENS